VKRKRDEKLFPGSGGWSKILVTLGGGGQKGLIREREGREGREGKKSILGEGKRFILKGSIGGSINKKGWNG